MPEQQTRLLASRYELIAPLGRGTMGTVWRAHDRLLGRDVAVKEIRHDPGLSELQRDELRERMIREGRAAAKITHPSVATVHDAIVVDGSPWIIMELVEARSLDQVLDEEGPLPPRLVAEIGLDLLGALGAAHDQGILHRDVKPANVLLTETGRVVLTDFGIAKAEGDSNITETGMVIGSPGYTAPERARGDHTGPESDLWSLGATLYFAVEGRPAYERRTVGETLAALMTEQADPATQAGPLRPVLEALLEKDHTKRLTRDRATALLRAIARTPATPAPSTDTPTPKPKPATTPAKPPPTTNQPPTPPARPANLSTDSANPTPGSTKTPPTAATANATPNPAAPPAHPANPTPAPAKPAPASARPSTTSAKPGPGSTEPPPAAGTGQNTSAGRRPAHQPAGTPAAASQASPPTSRRPASSADGEGTSSAADPNPSAGRRPAHQSVGVPLAGSGTRTPVEAAGEAGSGGAWEPRDADGSEPDPNQTMVVIRPKGGLRIPGVNPQTPPNGPTTGKASAGPTPPAPAAVDRAADDGRDGAENEDEDDQATMVGLLPPMTAGGPSSGTAGSIPFRTSGPSSPPPTAGVAGPSQHVATPHGRPAGSPGRPAADGRPAASVSDAPTRPPAPAQVTAQVTAPSMQVAPRTSTAPSDATPPTGFAASVASSQADAPSRPVSTPGTRTPAAPGVSPASATPAPGSAAPASGMPYGEDPQAEGVHQERGLGTDLFSFQGTAAPRGNSPVGMIVLIVVALLGLVAIAMLAAAALSDTGGAKGLGPLGTSGDGGSVTGPSTPGLATDTEPVSASAPEGQPAPGAAPDGRPISGTAPEVRLAPGAASGEQPTPSTAPAAGFRRYEDLSGYAIDLPEEFQSTVKGRSVGFGADGDVRAARVSRSPESSADILNTAKAAEARALAAGTYPGYERLRLTMTRPTPYPGTDVADWEFTYTTASGPVRVLSRWVAVPGGSTYAIYWSTPQSRWDAHWPQLAAVLASFRPARAGAPGGS
ncbi:protein kinase [Sphaerisporangium sp. NPDC051017]|uniref:serine/threonine-protein kinase n=1 Tax=Sphaerisporangium sp. NPDC051017 TaxID=3154636 RepID=UPI003427D819